MCVSFQFSRAWVLKTSKDFGGGDRDDQEMIPGVSTNNDDNIIRTVINNAAKSFIKSWKFHSSFWVYGTGELPLLRLTVSRKVLIFWLSTMVLLGPASILANCDLLSSCDQTIYQLKVYIYIHISTAS
ncbi:hypothetical protein L6452_24412 [Arctium lappa]|uniref:Uncharacterized protein n=1 Tax=Arctium lappa TaxID=4217 RepID=A0ACB9A9B7_ARCLA|nr:hypothetical protein L6452_24412 [Arctium lappa]